MTRHVCGDDCSAQVIAAFPATGKTWLAKHHPFFIDSDSSAFSWAQHGPEVLRSPYWPRNYVDHIKEQLAAGKRVLVSTHGEVREALVAAEIPFVLAYPLEGLRLEYIGRLWVRGSPYDFIQKIAAGWASMLASCRVQQGCEHRVLGAGEYLSEGACRFHSETCLGCSTALIFHQPVNSGDQGLRWARCVRCGLKHWLVRT